MDKDVSKRWWFYQQYELADNEIIPKEEEHISYYDPLDFYDVEDKEDIYLTFANLNLENQQAVIDFYNQYGPLGMLARSIRIIEPSREEFEGISESELSDFMTFSLPPNSSTMLCFISPEEDDQLWTLNYLPIPEKKVLEIDRQYRTTKIKPSNTDIQKYAYEFLTQFYREQRNFAWLLELYFAVNLKDIEYINKLLNKQYNNLTPKTDYLDTGIKIVMETLNKEVEKRTYQNLIYDFANSTIIREMHWKRDSLLTAFYEMFINDCINGKKVKKCANCERFYNTGRPQTRYCSFSCQNKAKTRKYRLQKKVREMYYTDKMEFEDIARSIDKDIDLVKKWVEMGKDRDEP